MISQIIEQQLAISAVLAEDRRNWHKLLIDKEIRLIEELCTVLENINYIFHNWLYY